MSEILCQAQRKIIKVLSKMIIIKSRHGSQEAINKLGGIKRQKSVPQSGSFDWRKLIAARTSFNFQTSTTRRYDTIYICAMSSSMFPRTSCADF